MIKHYKFPDKALPFKVDGSVLFWHGGLASTLEQAYEISINKWQCIVNNPSLDNGGITTCGLCHMFFMAKCTECPIRNHTGRMRCEGTPLADHVYYKTSTAAEAMLRLLRTLAEDSDFDIEYIEN